jgi:competence protein ComEA
MGSLLERYRGGLFFSLVALVLIALAAMQALRPNPQPIQLSTATPQPSPQATATPRSPRVYVSGAVREPDVYTLTPDSIVKDAILAAGGATGEADLDRINLALPVADGQHVYVPHQNEQDPPVPAPAGPSTAETQININTADQASLETLPGIGPALAQRIIDYRQSHGPFQKTEDLMEVSGIGPAILDSVRELITTD